MESPILNLIKQKHPEEEKVLFWCYSVMLDTDKNDQIEALSQYLLEEYSDDKFTCLLSHISNQKIDDFRFQLLVNNKFNKQTFTYTLPDAVYLICISPIKDEEMNFAKEIIRTKVGLIRLCLGNGIAKELRLEQILSVSDGELQGISNDIRLHKEIEGPSHDLLLIKDILDNINTRNESNKAKILRSLELIDFASTCNEHDIKFGLYFIAIDTLLPTFSSAEIYKLMKKHYSKSEKYVKEDLCIKTIIQARHSSFHDGLLFKIDQETERYMQIFCFEMIRAILGLPCLRLLEAHLNKYPLNLKSYNITEQVLR